MSTEHPKKEITEAFSTEHTEKEISVYYVWLISDAINEQIIRYTTNLDSAIKSKTCLVSLIEILRYLKIRHNLKI